MENLESKIKQVIMDKLGVSEKIITSKSKFADDMGADSLDLLEMVMAFEDEFDIEISDDDAEKLHTYGDAVKYLRERLFPST